MPERASGRLWHSLRDAAVRDLAWLLDSPDLFGPAPGVVPATPWAIPGLQAWARNWLTELDRAPARLHDVLNLARPTRLGRYAELLLGFFLEHTEALTLLAANLPLRSNGRTLGECDFLIETAHGVREHWELAVKCYVCAPHEGRAMLADFVGPGLADRLDHKYRRMVGHQLRLTEHEAFASLELPGPWQPRMFVKGWLFYRDGIAVQGPDELDAAHGRGFWVTKEAWPAWAAQQGAAVAWSVLPRLTWLAPRYLGNQAAPDADAWQVPAVQMPQPADALSAFWAQRTTTTMVAGFEADASGGWQETTRGFIVPDGWAERAASYARG